jgi:hypothetical protein
MLLLADRCGKPLRLTHPKEPLLRPEGLGRTIPLSGPRTVPGSGSVPFSLPKEGLENERPEGTSVRIGIRRSDLQRQARPSVSEDADFFICQYPLRIIGPKPSDPWTLRPRPGRPVDPTIHRRQPRLSPSSSFHPADRGRRSGSWMNGYGLLWDIPPKRDDSNGPSAETLVPGTFVRRLASHAAMILPLGRPKASLQPYQCIPPKGYAIV